MYGIYMELERAVIVTRTFRLVFSATVQNTILSPFAHFIYKVKKGLMQQGKRIIATGKNRFISPFTLYPFQYC